MDNKPLVSILCATYNQKDYIAQTIEGFLMQKVNFPFEIIIHDDASTDGTADIVRQYAEKYPDIIKPIFQTENQYSKKIGIWSTFIYPKARGKYLADCEGDDYWNNPNKLQKQVSFLEENPEYGLCYGIAIQYVQKKQQFSTTRGKDYQSFEYLLTHHNCIPTLTACYRRDLAIEYRQNVMPTMPRWSMGDLPMWLWFATQSKLKFIPEVMGVYRILESSAAHYNDIDKQIAFYKSGYDCANYFSKKFLNKELPPYEEHKERARLYSTKAHDRKKAFKEYLQIPNKNLKYRILAIMHSNPFTFAILRLYYLKRYQQ